MAQSGASGRATAMAGMADVTASKRPAATAMERPNRVLRIPGS